MAVVANHNRTNIILEFTDQDEMGNLQTRRVTLSNVRNELTYDEIYQFAQALGSLSKYSFSGVQKVHYQDLISA